ncbi:MAG: polya polymerase [Candidatus Copromonas sp.]|nr:polya polymerase [Candidatus Copromonas sp.]
MNQCDSAVELSLPEGGSVNLKSKLSQYFSMATVFSNGSIKELSLTTHNDEDSKRLIQYMVQGC